MYHNYTMMKYDTGKPDEHAAALISDNYALQLKLDGAGYVLAVDEDGVPHLNNGKISKKNGQLIDKIENVPHLKEWALANMPPSSQLGIEIYYHYDWTGAEPVYSEREYSRFVNSLMLALPPKAIARQKQTEWAQAIIFDCIFWDGEEVFKKDFIDRWAYCENLEGEYINPVLTIFGEDKATYIASWLEQGFEGGVLKMLRSAGRTDASYHVREVGSTPARPRHTSYKIKEIDTTDCVITRVIMPTSTYTGKDPENHPYKDENGVAINRLYALGIANSFGIGVYKDGELVEIGTVASGLNDEIRTALVEDPDSYIGQVAEFIMMSKDNAAGTFRHARYKCMRPDKDAEECTYEATFN